MNSKKITKQIWNKIKEYPTIIIHRHVNPDGDAYGVQYGLKHLILENLPHKKVLIAGKDLEDLNYIGQADQVILEDYKDALVIIGDCANIERIDGEFWNQGKYVIKIDHHPLFEHYGDFEWINEKCPSASEMIAQIAYDNKLKLNKQAAKAIYHGMVTDTGRFIYGVLSANTFNLISFLFKTEFDWENLYSSLYTKTLNIIRFEAFVLSNFKVTLNGVAYIKLTPNVLEKYNITKEKANSAVNLLANIANIPIWLFCSQDNNDNFIRLSIRSSGLKINTVALKHSGGGHQRASGIKCLSWKAVDEVIKDLDHFIELNKNFNISEGFD